MIYLKDCPVGYFVDLYTNSFGLADFQSKTNTFMRVTYLGWYDKWGDNHLIGLKSQPVCKIDKLMNVPPKEFASAPRIANANQYLYFRWAGGDRFVHNICDMDNAFIGASNPVSAGLKTSQLSPRHVPGWHECKCGFRNQDISESAFIAGKYVCFSCRNIWKK